MDKQDIARKNRRRLILYFDSGVKAQDDCKRLGVEVEHLVVTDDGEPVPYASGNDAVGIREVLEHLATWYPQGTSNTHGDLLGLLGEEGSVTLEPAAQLELSAVPYERIADNTPVYEGETNHVPIRRLQLWREVDLRRCGTVPGVFEDGFGFERYVDWLLSTSPIFVTRPETGNPNGPTTRPFFEEPASEAYADAPMESADVEHLISMFWPDVRLKRFVEIRPADSLPQAQMLGYAALVKGIFYCEESLAAIENVLGVSETAYASRGGWPINARDVDDAIAQVQGRGLFGEVYGMSILAWEHLLFSLARHALGRDEAAYLVPLEEFAVQKPWWDVE